MHKRFRTRQKTLAEGFSDDTLPAGFPDITLAEGFVDRYGQHEATWLMP